MSRTTTVLALVLGTVGLGLTGCMPHMTMEDLKAMKPKRPAELDRLEQFVGKWQYTGECRMSGLDEPIKSGGTGQYEWAGDRGYLIGHGTMDIEPFGPTQMHEMWTYDSHDKKYRSTYVDGMGMIGMGESTYREKDQTWHMTATSYGPWGKSTMKGTMRFADPDTMEWTMQEHQGLMKIMEMKGTGKRVK